MLALIRLLRLLRSSKFLKKISRAKAFEPNQNPPLALLQRNLEFDFVGMRQEATDLKAPLVGQLVCFRDFGKTTRVFEAPVQTATGKRFTVPTYVNEFWTAKQRAASSLQEISYRACFKPQLPRFLIIPFPRTRPYR